MTILLRSRRLLRRLSTLALPPLLVLIAVSILGVQFKEISTRTEILPLSSFIVLISFSALAFNWCRVSSDLASPAILSKVYHAGVDFFLASMLALVATFFAWLKTSSFFPEFLYPVFFAIHLIFLVISLLLSLIAMLFLLSAAAGAGDERG